MQTVSMYKANDLVSRNILESALGNNHPELQLTDYDCNGIQFSNAESGVYFKEVHISEFDEVTPVGVFGFLRNVNIKDDEYDEQLNSGILRYDITAIF